MEPLLEPGVHLHADRIGANAEPRETFDAYTAPRTWTAGEVVTASIMNLHVRDNISFLYGARDYRALDAEIVVDVTNDVTVDEGFPTFSLAIDDPARSVLYFVWVGERKTNQAGGSANVKVHLRVDGTTSVDEFTIGALGNAYGAAVQLDRAIRLNALAAGSRSFTLRYSDFGDESSGATNLSVRNQKLWMDVRRH